MSEAAGRVRVSWRVSMEECSSGRCAVARKSKENKRAEEERVAAGEDERRAGERRGSRRSLHVTLAATLRQSRQAVVCERGRPVCLLPRLESQTRPAWDFSGTTRRRSSHTPPTVLPCPRKNRADVHTARLALRDSQRGCEVERCNSPGRPPPQAAPPRIKPSG